MKIVTGNRLNEFWDELKGVFVPKSKVLKTMEEIEANTNEENVAGATALKAVNNKLGHGRVEIVVINDCRLGYKLDGADTVIPFTDLSQLTHLAHEESILQSGSRSITVPAGVTRMYALVSRNTYGDGSGVCNISGTISQRTLFTVNSSHRYGTTYNSLIMLDVKPGSTLTVSYTVYNGSCTCGFDIFY